MRLRADKPLMEERSSCTTEKLWKLPDSSLTRIGKLIAAAHSSQDKRELLEKLVKAAQTIEGARLRGDLSDEDARRITDLLISLFSMQPAFDQVSKTVENYFSRHLEQCFVLRV